MTQQQNIAKTVLITISIMVVILLLFFNKIVTPRYLSAIELKINGLELLKQPQPVFADSDDWVLLFKTPAQQQMLTELVAHLGKTIQRQTQIKGHDELGIDLQLLPYNSEINIGIIQPKNQLIAYFKEPFDHRKMILIFF